MVCGTDIASVGCPGHVCGYFLFLSFSSGEEILDLSASIIFWNRFLVWLQVRCRYQTRPLRFVGARHRASLSCKVRTAGVSNATVSCLNEVAGI